jgi:hypothetical protein
MPLFPNEEIKQYINSLKCPICECSLEGAPKLLTDGHTEEIDLYCAWNGRSDNHYRLYLTWDLNINPILPKRTLRALHFNYNNIHYRIIKTQKAERIFIHDLNPDDEIIDPSHTYLSFDGELEISPFNSEKLANRIELLRFYQ